MGPKGFHVGFPSALIRFANVCCRLGPGLDIKDMTQSVTDYHYERYFKRETQEGVREGVDKGGLNRRTCASHWVAVWANPSQD